MNITLSYILADSEALTAGIAYAHANLELHDSHMAPRPVKRDIVYTQFMLINLLIGFSVADTFRVIWRRPPITGGWRPHTYEY